MVTDKARIYMAGPLGFSEAGRHFYTCVLAPFLRLDRDPYIVVADGALFRHSFRSPARQKRAR